MSKEELGTVTDQTDAAWANFAPLQTVDITFDTNSRPVQQNLSSGGTAYALTQTSYDSLGRVDCMATRMNPAVYGSLPAACTASIQGSFGPDQISETQYDAASHVTQQLVGVGSSDAATERTMSWTNNGQMASLTDGDNNKTSYVYDGFDRLSQTQYPSATQGAGISNSSDFEQLTYDANGNVTARRLRDGNSILFTYDNLNRVTLKNLPGTEPDVSYGYDNLGRLTSASETGNSMSFTYDALSRKLTEVGPQGTITSAYDLAGERTSITYPGSPALTINTAYLTTGEVSTIKDGTTSLATYAYDNLGNRTSATLGNGVVQSYAHDPVSRLTSLTNDLAGTTNDLTIGSISYNPASQIMSVARSNDVYAWNGSANVNRGYTSNGLNQYSAAGPATFTYDAKGNLTSDGTNTFGYSSENLLTSAPGTTLTYDPWMRLYQVAGSTTTPFAYDGINILADYDGSNNLQHRYVFGPGLDHPIVEYSSTAVRTYLSSDERGSIIARSDSSGNLATANTYDEYGIPGSSNAGLFQYTGQAYLPQVGMYYYKNRFYSTTLGRFMQTDPIGYADNANLYAYVHNDPVNLVDPLGLCDDDPSVIVVCGGPGGIGGPGGGEGGGAAGGTGRFQVLPPTSCTLCNATFQSTPDGGAIITGKRLPPPAFDPGGGGEQQGGLASLFGPLLTDLKQAVKAVVCAAIPHPTGTVQGGISGTVEDGSSGLLGSVTLAYDPTGTVALVISGGFAAGPGLQATGGVTFVGSNARTVSDLAGGFEGAQGSIAAVEGATIGGFTGSTADGFRVVGGDVSINGGAGASLTGTFTGSHVTPLVNLPSLAGC